MECVRYEWKKFIAFRFFWLLCVVAFLFNLWNLSEQAKMSWPGGGSKRAVRGFETTAGGRAGTLA